MNRAKFTASGLLAINPTALGIEFLLSGPADRKNRTIGDCAIVDIRGPLEHHAGGMFDSYDAIKDRVRDALASSARAVVLAFDSPGGLVSGVYEASQEIRAMASAAHKPLVAYVNGECSSAAYALACSATKIVVPLGGMLGSIGVIAMSVDATAADRAMGLRFEASSSGARKTDGNPHVAMTDESLSAIQQTVDAQAAVFFVLVGNRRGISPDAVRGFQAGLFVGQQAKEVGLADEIGTLDELVRAGAVTATPATAAMEISAMNMKEIRKCLGEKAAGNDDEAKQARAALAAMDGDGDGDGDKKPADDEKAESDVESDDDKKKKEDESKAEADDGSKGKAEAEPGAAAATSNVISLASRVQTLEAERQSEKDATERKDLLASRADLVPDVRAWLEKQPLAVVRDAVRSLPKGPLTVGAPAAAAQSDVRPTVGLTQSQAQGSSVLNEKQLLDERMGIGRSATSAITFDGATHSMRVLTAEDARALRADKAKAAGK